MRVQRNNGKITIEEPTFGRDKAKGSASKKGKSNAFPVNEKNKPKKW